ncbi:MAG: GIY-YIG nuclease family protein [Fibrobacteria bacterium]|nr:GIY-YIG nuclease family protein [Fibrobacteria bacterium]
MKSFFVYIMANHRPTIYVGITNNLQRRIYEHKSGLNRKAFTSKYKLRKLVYYEILNDSYNAIIREKQIKNMSRTDKLKMVSDFNPEWMDLYSKLFKALDSGQAGMTGCKH